MPLGFVDVLGRFGIEREGAEHDDLRAGGTAHPLRASPAPPAAVPAPRARGRSSPPRARRSPPACRCNAGNACRVASRDRRTCSICPPLPRMPVFSSSSRHVCWRDDSPERAMPTSASGAWSSACSSAQHQTGNGTASTVNGPGDAQLGLGDLRVVVEHLLIGVRGDRGVHLLLHRLAGFVEGVERGARSAGPAFGKVERHFPFEQRSRGSFLHQSGAYACGPLA